MPFTPFHMGAGIVIKAVVQKRFSLLIFGLSQILVDLQPLLVILTGKGVYHGMSHSYVGATALAVVAAIGGKFLFDSGFRLVRRQWFQPISWPTAWLSAFVGTYSHVLIDSITHKDVMPFAPFIQSNSLPGRVSDAAMEIFLVFCGLAGCLVWFVLREQRRKN